MNCKKKNCKLKNEVDKQHILIKERDSELVLVEQKFKDFKIKIECDKEKNDTKIEELKRDIDVLKSKLAKEKTNQDLQKQQLDRVVKEKKLNANAATLGSGRAGTLLCRK